MNYMSLRAWVKASRPFSIVNVFFPLLLGQSFSKSILGLFESELFGILMLFAFLCQIVLVFLNDFADSDADKLNEKPSMISGGSRVLPLNLIQAKLLMSAALAGILVQIAIGIGLTIMFDRELALPLIGVQLILIWMYSFHPVKLNYRGGGEVLQALGCGVVLPVFGYYIQAGTLLHFPWFLIIPYFLYQLASAIATTIPDMEADRLGGKKTMVTTHGMVAGGWFVWLLLLAGFGLNVVNDASFEGARGLFLNILPVVALLLAFVSNRKKDKSRTALVYFGGLTLSVAVLYSMGFTFAAFFE